MKFVDALCQMVDLIKPQDPCRITLQDLTESKPMSGIAINQFREFRIRLFV